jgi:uncharacterized membrane protein
MITRGFARLQSPADERFERRMGRMLGAGVAVAAVLLLAGLALWTLGMERLMAERLLHAGFIVLMLTPVLRVIASVVGFAQERDWVFALITVGVLILLAGGLWMALSR